MQKIIRLSLPMELGQKRVDGKKKRSRAYRRGSICGTAIRTARYIRYMPMNPMAEKRKKPPAPLLPGKGNPPAGEHLDELGADQLLVRRVPGELAGAHLLGQDPADA